MTSTSPDAVVLHDLPDETVAPAALSQDLRTGRWTRFGHGGVLGDPAAEATLHGLAERSHAAAQAQGYAVGWSAGCRMATARATAAAAQEARRREEERSRREQDQALAATALATAVDRLDRAFQDANAAVADRAVELAMQIAEAVLGREIDRSADPGADALRRALDLVPPAAPVLVRLHPEDRDGLDLSVLDGRPVRLVADPALQRGDAVVEAEDTVVDATVDAALDRVRKVLLP